MISDRISWNCIGSVPARSIKKAMRSAMLMVTPLSSDERKSGGRTTAVLLGPSPDRADSFADPLTWLVRGEDTERWGPAEI